MPPHSPDFELVSADPFHRAFSILTHRPQTRCDWNILPEEIQDEIILTWPGTHGNVMSPKALCVWYCGCQICNDARWANFHPCVGCTHPECESDWKFILLMLHFKATTW
jgi:hypothetical protein